MLTTDVADTLRLAKECLLTPSGTPWPVSATTIIERIDAAVALVQMTAPARTPSGKDRS